MKASTLSFRSAVCLGIIGMSAGIVMAVSNNHAPMPAHAHLNLLGWVSMFLMGAFYRLHPTLDHSRLALTQVLAWLIGTIILASGVALIYTGRPEMEPVAAVGSLIVLAAMFLFAYLVFRPEETVSTIRPFAAAAE